MFELTKRALIALLLATFVMGTLPGCSSTDESSGSTSTSEGSSTSDEPPNCDQAITQEDRAKCWEALEDEI